VQHVHIAKTKVSQTNARTNLVPKIHAISSIDSIYIVCQEKSNPKPLTKERSKLNDIFVHAIFFIQKD